MRRKIVAGNWKMNLTIEEGKTLVDNILEGLGKLDDGLQVVLAPPFVHLVVTGIQLEEYGDHIHLGAQNCHQEASGAYTGEVSAAMLRGAGVRYVIIGHSERRQYFNESDAIVAQKTNQVLNNKLEVIFCCGEPLDIRDAGTQNEYVEKQVAAGLFHLTADQMKYVVIAYEPIWAIGTGRNATAGQAQDMHAHIRSVIAAKYGQQAADDTTILYGGSCKPSNAAELFACPDVDGGLIGGASLKAGEFLSIINAMLDTQKI